jgi:hypothetical protein
VFIERRQEENGREFISNVISGNVLCLSRTKHLIAKDFEKITVDSNGAKRRQATGREEVKGG